MRSTLLPGQPWEVMVDLFFYREPEETKEPGEEDAADYGGDQGYNALPAPGGKLPSYAHCFTQHANVACIPSSLFTASQLCLYCVKVDFRSHVRRQVVYFLCAVGCSRHAVVAGLYIPSSVGWESSLLGLLCAGVPDQSWDESVPAGAGFGQDAPAPPAADEWGAAPAAGAAGQ